MIQHVWKVSVNPQELLWTPVSIHTFVILSVSLSAQIMETSSTYTNSIRV